MGTRHLICVVVNDEIKLAQYGQWDGYPEGQGVKVLEFVRWLKEPGALSKAVEVFSSLEVASPEDVIQSWIACGADEQRIRSDGMVSFEIGQVHKTKFPEYSRDTGANVLPMIMDRAAEGRPVKIQSVDPSFAADSLFCEWAYVVDLTNKRLEVFKGFQKAPHNKGRFAALPLDTNRDGTPSGYWPVAEVCRFEFDDLPANGTFVAVLQPPEEAE